MIHFTGDINLTDGYFYQGFGLGTRISKGLDPYKYIERDSQDLWVGNFEGVASSVSINSGVEADLFRIEPACITKIKHFDFYCFANNHAMQHGAEAYTCTIDTLAKGGAMVFGTLKNKSRILRHQKREISLTGLSLRIDEFSDKTLYWHNPELIAIKDEIGLLSEKSYKVLYVHWGNEYANYPSIEQKKFAHWLIDIGFDLIIGMHPHVLQGYEDYKGKRIYYSLGNFVFNMAGEDSAIGAIVNLDFRNDMPVLSEDYIKIGSDGCPRFVSKEQIPLKYHFEYLNKQLMKESNPEQYYSEVNKACKAYRKENHKTIIRNSLHHPKSGVNMIVYFLKRKLNF